MRRAEGGWLGVCPGPGWKLEDEIIAGCNELVRGDLACFAKSRDCGDWSILVSEAIDLFKPHSLMYVSLTRWEC